MRTQSGQWDDQQIEGLGVLNSTLGRSGGKSACGDETDPTSRYWVASENWDVAGLLEQVNENRNHCFRMQQTL